MRLVLACTLLLSLSSAVVVRDAAGLRQALSVGGAVDLASNLVLLDDDASGGALVATAPAGSVVRGHGHSIVRRGAAGHFRVATALELYDLELAVAPAPTPQPTCAPSSSTKPPSVVSAPLELLSVSRAGPSTRGCGWSEAGTGAHDVIIFGGRSATEDVADCEGDRHYPAEAWARAVDGTGEVATLAAEGATGLAAVGATGVAVLLADKRSLRLVAPDGRATTFAYAGPGTHHLEEQNGDDRLVVLDVYASGEGVAGAIAVLNKDINEDDRFLEVYAAATSAGPLELTATFEVSRARMRRVSRVAYDGAASAIYLLGLDDAKERTLARLEVAADHSELSLVWSTGLGVFSGVGMLAFRADEVAVTHFQHFVRVRKEDGAVVFRRANPFVPDANDYRMTYDATRDCFYAVSSDATTLVRYDAATADATWSIAIVAAFPSLAAAEGPPLALGVHASTDGRIRLVLEYAEETRIAIFEGDVPTGERVPTSLPTAPVGCAGDIAEAPAAEAESCVTVGPEASFTAMNVTFMACATAGSGGAVNSVDATVRVDNCVFNGSRADGAGGAIFLNRGTLTVSGSAFAATRAGVGVDATAVVTEANVGGALRAIDAALSVSDTSFTGTESSGGGGAISAVGGTLFVRGSDFHRCRTVGPGGAIDFAGQSLHVADSDFVACEVPLRKTGEGGAIRSDSLSTTITGSLFEACKTNKRQGAALAVDGGQGDLTIESSRFVRNIATANGVLRAHNLATLRMRDTAFEGNALSLEDHKERSVIILSEIFQVEVTSSTFRANMNQVLRAYRFPPGTFVIDDCVFADNVDSERLGGAALLFKTSPSQELRITRTVFSRNKLLSGEDRTYGGAIDLKSRGWIDDCVFEANSADEGGAIYMDATADLKLSNSTFVANEAVVGGAISACATSNDYTCAGELCLADVIGTGNIAKSPDGETSGGGFAYVTGAVTKFRGVSLADNVAAGSGSAVGFFYADAALFNVEAAADQMFVLTKVGHVDVYCDEISVELSSGDADILSADFYPEECSRCLAGAEWSGDACEPCTPGFSKGTGDAECMPCGPGLFQLEPGAAACEPCPSGYEPVEAATACSKRHKSSDDDDAPEWVIPVCVSLVAIVLLAALAQLVVQARRFVLHKRNLEVERAITVQQQVVEATERVSEFQAHFCAVPGDVFLAMGELKSHEDLLGQTLVFPTLKDVRDASADGAVFVFLSHQWLGFEHPDPNKVHYAAMRQAVKSVAAEASVDVDKIRVWADFCSIPQQNRSEQRFAIKSLPTFASCCDFFVVVAPNAIHSTTQCACDSRSYRSRAWCRAEIMSCWAKNGTKDMFFSSNSGLKPLAMEDSDLVEALDVFAGDLTCCRLGHPNAQPCDREDLMLPMLGLFADIYRHRRGRSKKAFEAIEPILDHLYPRTFEWTHAGRRETQPLFGDLIDACKFSEDVAEAANDDPILKRVPDFQPGTNARRRLLHGAMKHFGSNESAKSSSTVGVPLRSDSSVSWSRSISRSDSNAKSPTPDPGSLRPKYSRSLTWRCTPPKTLTPTRYNSTPNFNTTP